MWTLDNVILDNLRLQKYVGITVGMHTIKDVFEQDLPETEN